METVSKAMTAMAIIIIVIVMAIVTMVIVMVSIIMVTVLIIMVWVAGMIVMIIIVIVIMDHMYSIQMRVRSDNIFHEEVIEALLVKHTHLFPTETPDISSG